MTGTQSSTMPSGELVVDWNAATTFSRLIARILRWPLPFLMVSRRMSASASMSKSAMIFLSASAPMPPWK